MVASEDSNYKTLLFNNTESPASNQMLFWKNKLIETFQRKILSVTSLFIREVFLWVYFFKRASDWMQGIQYYWKAVSYKLESSEEAVHRSDLKITVGHRTTSDQNQKLSHQTKNTPDILSDGKNSRQN